MADVMKIVYSGTTIEFSPREGYISPGRLKIKRHESMSGVLYSYKRGFKFREEIPLNKIPKADADNINTWTQNNYTVSFYPDLENDPATVYLVKIVNDELPLNMMYASGWANYYEGEIIVQEIG